MLNRGGGAGIVALALALGLGIAMAGCSRTPTSDELRSAIEAYAKDAPEATAEKIDALFAKLDAEIAGLRAEAVQKDGEARSATEQEADDLAQQRRDLHGAYLKARFARVGDAAGKALESAGEAIGKGVEDMGRKLRESAEGSGEREDAAAAPPPGAPPDRTE